MEEGGLLEEERLIGGEERTPEEKEKGAEKEKGVEKKEEEKGVEKEEEKEKEEKEKGVEKKEEKEKEKEEEEKEEEDDFDYDFDYETDYDDFDEEAWLRSEERINNDFDRHQRVVRRRKHEFDSKVKLFIWWGEERLPFPFPRDITFDILSRLPIESLLDCRQVCRTWRDYILLTSFADLHLRRRFYGGGKLLLPPQPLDHYTGDVGKVGFLFLTMEKYSYLYYGEYNENGDNRCYMTMDKINHSQFKKRINTSAIVGSCNGLICSSIACSFRIDDPVYIFNPITKEFLYIPRFEMPYEYKKTIMNKRSYTSFYMVNGFGYHPSTDLYKIVRIFYSGEQQPTVGHVQVYTLGNERGWRNKGDISYSLFRRTYGPSRGVLADGSLHWLDYKEWKIVAFDLANEEFSLVPSPPCFNPNGPNNFQLHVLGGCLCVAHENVGESFDISLFKKKTGDWESMFKIKIRKGRPIDVYWPIALTMSGELLLRYDSKYLVRYNPKTATLKKIADLTTSLAPEQFSLNLVEAIPHMHSFVSLKALEEKSKKRRRSEDSD